MKLYIEKIINIQQNKIFDFIVEHKNFQHILPDYFLFTHILSMRNEVSVMKNHIKILGKVFVVLTKHVIKYPDSYEIFIIGGNGKGSSIILKYIEFSKRTKLTLTVDLKFNGIKKLVQLIYKNKIKNELLNMFMKLIIELEQKS